LAIDATILWRTGPGALKSSVHFDAEAAVRDLDPLTAKSFRCGVSEMQSGSLHWPRRNVRAQARGIALATRTSGGDRTQLGQRPASRSVAVSKNLQGPSDMGDGLSASRSSCLVELELRLFGGATPCRTSIGVTANYHFKMVDKKFYPFIGAGLGYEIVNVNASCVYLGVDYCRSYSSEIYVIIKGGIRYFISPATALYADVGAGAATLNVGAMFG
jgi:hypothetical protein